MAAQAEPPESSPRPQARAAEATMADVVPDAVEAAGATIAMAVSTSARPRLRPATTPATAGAEAAAPAAEAVSEPVPAAQSAQSQAAASSIAAAAVSPRPEQRPAGTALYQIVSAAVRTQPAPEAIIGRQGAVCGMAGIEGQMIPPITSNVKGCGVEEPVRVSAVDGVPLSQASVMDCNTARALNTWVQRGVKPAIGRTGGGVVQLQVAGHYICRTRNHKAGAAVSEHGRGKAIDVSGFRLANGEVVTVLNGWKDRRYNAALKQMHRAGCGIFGTTLGPGSDGYHEDHFHYDTASRRNGAYCR